MNPVPGVTRHTLHRGAMAAAGLLLGLMSAAASAGTALGKRPFAPALRSANAAPAASVAVASGLRNVVSASGNVYLSTDGVGSNAPGAQLRVDKRSAASTVRSAHLLVASAGFSQHLPDDGDLLLGGAPVDIDEATRVDTRVFAVNARADVTAIVKPLVDAAAPGLISLPVVETRPELIDGSILAVVFDDPAVADGTVLLYFGSHSAGDNRIDVNLVDPIGPDVADRGAEFTIGIAFSAQDSSDQSQSTVIDVNAITMTRLAGGQDDGALELGALLTVGGIGDSPDVPGLISGCTLGARCDDERYALEQAMAVNSRNIGIRFNNESADDNILFASFASRGTRAVSLVERLTATPASQTLDVRQNAEVAVQLETSVDDRRAGRRVDLAVLNGNVVTPPFGTTDADGRVRFAVPCLAAGRSFVEARVVGLNSLLLRSPPIQITCNALATRLTAEPSRLSLGSGLRQLYRARLETLAPLLPESGELLRVFDRDGQRLCIAITDDDGVGECVSDLPPLQTLLLGGFRVEFEGSAELLPASASGRRGLLLAPR